MGGPDDHQANDDDERGQVLDHGDPPAPSLVQDLALASQGIKRRSSQGIDLCDEDERADHLGVVQKPGEACQSGIHSVSSPSSP